MRTLKMCALFFEALLFKAVNQTTIAFGRAVKRHGLRGFEQFALLFML